MTCPPNSNMVATLAQDGEATISAPESAELGMGKEETRQPHAPVLESTALSQAVPVLLPLPPQLQEAQWSSVLSRVHVVRLAGSSCLLPLDPALSEVVAVVQILHPVLAFQDFRETPGRQAKDTEVMTPLSSLQTVQSEGAGKQETQVDYLLRVLRS